MGLARIRRLARVLALSMLAVAYTTPVFCADIVISDPEQDLGVILAGDFTETAGAGATDAIVLQPEKLAVLGIFNLQKGDRLKIVRQVKNLLRIEHTASGAAVRIRVRWKSNTQPMWPFPEVP